MNKNNIKPLIVDLFEKNSLIDRGRNNNNINACSKKPLDSIIHQIDRFFIDLEDQSSIFNWLPYKCLTDDEIAYIGFFYINRATDNRLITHNYKGKDVTYDFLQILPEHLLKKIKPDFIIDIIKKLPENKEISISTISNPSEIFYEVSADNKNFIWESNQLCGFPYSDLNQFITRYISKIPHSDYQACGDSIESLSEKIEYEILRYYGPLSTKLPNYTIANVVNEYISVTDTICCWMIMRFVVINKSVADKRLILEKIQTDIEDANDRIKEIHDIVSLSASSNINDNTNTPHNPTIFLYYLEFLNRHFKNKELDSIHTALIDEIKQNQALFNKPNKIDLNQRNDYTDQEIKKLITEGNNVSRYYKKRQFAEAFIEKSSSPIFINTNSIFYLKVVFQAFFLPESKYKGFTSATLLRDYFRSGELPSQGAGIMFINEKILRGIFKEVGQIDVYEQYITTCSLIRHTLESTLLLFNMHNAATEINSICNRVIQCIISELNNGNAS